MQENGIIVDISKELYYVKTKDNTFMAKARGLFRKNNLFPMVGDNVKIEILENDTAYINEVYPRKNQILRPPVSNIDQTIIVISFKEPEINYRILDRYIMYYEIKNIPMIICLNKCDLIDEKLQEEFISIYSKLGYKVVLNSINMNNIEYFKSLCSNKISVITGPSGVGKSTLLNSLNSKYEIWTGEISKKTKRGKHTTRAATLYEIFDNSFIIDTAGFTSLDITKFVENETEIRDGFVEFKANGECRFSNCMHINEPNCMVKELVECGDINKSRYESYLFYLEEYRKNRRY